MSGGHVTPEQVRRLVAAAYERGWYDACADWSDQEQNPDTPIGKRKQPGVSVLVDLDPYDLLGVRP